MNNDTKTIFKTMPVVLAMTMMTPTVVNVDSSICIKEVYNRIQDIPNLENLTVTVEKIDIESKSNYEKALSLFDGEMKDFTKEEAIAYEQSLDNLYKSTGVNILELC